MKIVMNNTKASIFEVKVKTRAKENKVIKEKNSLKVFVKNSPEKGKANKEVIDVFADYLKCPKTNITIIKGLKNTHKILKVEKPLFRDKIKVNLSKKHCWSR